MRAVLHDSHVTDVVKCERCLWEISIKCNIKQTAAETAAAAAAAAAAALLMVAAAVLCERRRQPWLMGHNNEWF
jgi:hypothetical protein